jgi:hypothetical protein
MWLYGIRENGTKWLIFSTIVVEPHAMWLYGIRGNDPNSVFLHSCGRATLQFGSTAFGKMAPNG